MAHFYASLPTLPYLNYQIIGILDNYVYISNDICKKNSSALNKEPCLRIMKKHIFDETKAVDLWTKSFDALGCFECDEFNASLALYTFSTCKRFIYVLATKILEVRYGLKRLKFSQWHSQGVDLFSYRLKIGLKIHVFDYWCKKWSTPLLKSWQHYCFYFEHF